MNSWLTSIVYVVDVWIGLRLNLSDDEFYWDSDGTLLDVDWHPWKPGKPNNQGTGEACGVAFFHASGQWDDKPESGRQGHFHPLCEQ